jgi:hypothetical protein
VKGQIPIHPFTFKQGAVMKKFFLLALIPLCFLCFICSGCSRAKEAEPEKGSIDKFTEQTGREAAEAIKKPINKAKDIDKMAQERIKNLEKQDAEKSE